MFKSIFKSIVNNDVQVGRDNIQIVNVFNHQNDEVFFLKEQVKYLTQQVSEINKHCENCAKNCDKNHTKTLCDKQSDKP